jgi:hypothetical protein
MDKDKLSLLWQACILILLQLLIHYLCLAPGHLWEFGLDKGWYLMFIGTAFCIAGVFLGKRCFNRALLGGAIGIIAFPLLLMLYSTMGFYTGDLLYYGPLVLVMPAYRASPPGCFLSAPEPHIALVAIVLSSFAIAWSIAGFGIGAWLFNRPKIGALFGFMVFVVLTMSLYLNHILVPAY